MGMTYITFKIKNPSKPEKIINDDFLIDSGALYTVLTPDLVKQLDLEPEDEEHFMLADGTKIMRKVSHALINFEGHERASTVVLGESGDHALVGVLTLEELGLMFDPIKRTVKRAKLRW